MTVTTQITERDKKLLLFLALFLIVAGFGLLVIRPLAGACETEQMELENQEYQMEENQMKLSLLSSRQQQETLLKQEAVESAADFYPALSSQEIDKLVTGIVLKQGLEARQLVIGLSAEDMVLTPYPYSAAALSGASKDAADQSGAQSTVASGSGTADAAAAEAAGENPEGTGAETGDTESAAQLAEDGRFPGFRTAQVTVGAVGERSSLRRLVDDLSQNYPAIRITSVNYGTENVSVQNAEGQYGISQTDTLNMTLEIYMCTWLEEE